MAGKLDANRKDAVAWEEGQRKMPFATRLRACLWSLRCAKIRRAGPRSPIRF